MANLARGLMGLLRTLLGLCALVLVLLALYVSLGRELLPWVAEYRLEVEDRATAALGMPVRIAALEGRWQGLAPLLVARDVQVGEGAGRVQLDQVRVRPDLLGSLRARQLRIARLELDGLQLVVQEDAEGRWSLKGLPQREAAAPMDVAELLTRTQVLQRLSLHNSQITLQAHEQPPRTLTYLNLSLRNGPARQRLDARLLLPDGQPLALQLRTRMQAQSWRELQAELYLSLPQSDWAAWIPSGLLRDWRLNELRAGGEVWLSWAEGAVSRAVARLHVPRLQAGYAAREPVLLDNLALNGYFQRNAEGFALQLDDLAFSRDQQRWGEVRLTLNHVRESAEQEQQWQLAVDHLDLAPLQPLVAALAPLPGKTLALLEQLKPHGALHHIQLDYRPEVEGPLRLQFAANLERIGFNAYLGSPAAENVSGSLSGDLAQGELRLDSEDFALHLATLFPKPWRYQHANARLTWQLDEQAFTLRSPYLQVRGEEGEIAGDFLIRLLFDPAAEDYMDLRVGLRQGDARYTEKYLPTLSPGLSPQLADWLKTAIRGAQVQEGFFQYQGSLNKGAEPSARSLSLFFAVEEAELAFQRGWPALREGRGTVFVEDSGVRVELAAGRILDSRIDAAQALIATQPGQVPHLLLNAELSSSLGDALHILQRAPIGTAELFAGWSGQGALAGRLKLDLPLRAGQAPAVVVDFASDDASLNMANPALQLSELQGAFRYDTGSGLSAPDIRARVLGHEVRGKIVANGSREQPRSRIEATGRVGLTELSGWLGVSQPLPLSGSLPYRLRLTLDGQDSQLRVDSNLQGLAIDLPAPFGKAATEERYADWRMTLSGAERRYWLDYAERASLSFAAPVGRMGEGRGELRLGGGAASLPVSQGVRLRGSLAELDWSAWQAALQPYAQISSESSFPALQDARLDIGRFQGYGIELAALDVQLKRQTGAFNLLLDSEQIKGRLVLPDQKNDVINVDLQHLRFPAVASVTAESESMDKPDPLAGVDTRQIPAMNLHISQVWQGQELLGAWSVKLRPDAEGLLIRDLDINLKGLKLEGRASWLRVGADVQTAFKGRLQGGDLADVLIAWGYAPSLSSGSFKVEVDGRWPGSPAWFALKRFSGDMDISLRQGQLEEVQGPASALRVFGVLNFNSISRRLRLDFSDLLGRGLSYDRLKGELKARRGVFVTREPLTLEGPSSNLQLEGTLDMASEQINAKLLVTVPVTNNLPLAAIIVGAPAIGGALFIADKLLGNRVARFASVQYDVKGPWQDPDISFDKPFEKPQ
ncbi:YhdP family protein [Pseudomonas xionganensis]|uniref:TIGR02099 family protein n=1 Tax=Pseudomonas xionganensis TaxID=2654845 RepID=A0A6I4KSL6_9PSED|nr:YhdP family protein [Pseudomonas xionganensis]MVW74728.1 TIGR02099 family protein [Pseudomonas xionganensis]